jgi:hypothetical protein
MRQTLLLVLLLLPGVVSAEKLPAARRATSAARRAPDLILKVKVRRVFLSRLKGSRRHYVVEAQVLRVVHGSFAGRRFDFRVHSPARAGLRAGAVVQLEAAKVKGGGYLVDEAAFRSAANDCFDRCLRRSSMQAVAWEAIKARCRRQCAAQSSSPSQGPQQPPKLPWSRDRVCKVDKDCVLRPRSACSCAPCARTWRTAINRGAHKRLLDAWARRRCRKPICPACFPQWLGNRAVCIEGQCAVR